MKSDYQILRKQFDARVSELQERCKHKDTSWAEHWWAIGHSSGYKVLICNNCMKELEQNPTEEEREVAKKKWLEENNGRFKNL